MQVGLQFLTVDGSNDTTTAGVADTTSPEIGEEATFLEFMSLEDIVPDDTDPQSQVLSSVVRQHALMSEKGIADIGGGADDEVASIRNASVSSVNVDASQVRVESNEDARQVALGKFIDVELGKADLRMPHGPGPKSDISDLSSGQADGAIRRPGNDQEISGGEPLGLMNKEKPRVGQHLAVSNGGTQVSRNFPEFDRPNAAKQKSNSASSDHVGAGPIKSVETSNSTVPSDKSPSIASVPNGSGVQAKPPRETADIAGALTEPVVNRKKAAGGDRAAEQTGLIADKTRNFPTSDNLNPSAKDGFAAFGRQPPSSRMSSARETLQQNENRVAEGPLFTPKGASEPSGPNAVVNATRLFSSPNDDRPRRAMRQVDQLESPRAEGKTGQAVAASKTGIQVQEKPSLSVPIIFVGPMTETTFSSDLSHADVDVVGAGNLREGPETTKSVWSASQRALDGLGRSAVTQIVHAAKSASDGVIEVRLSPEELGRVRFSMTAGDAGMVVQIAAERPETLELLRRNIDLLAADLEQQGFSNLEFAFGQDRQTSQTFDEHPDGHESSAPISQSDVIPGVDQDLILKAVLDGRVDIRL